MEYDIHLPVRHHGMTLEHINKCAFLLLQELHKQTLLLFHPFRMENLWNLCKGSRFLDYYSGALITPVGQMASIFKLVSFIALPVFISLCIVTKAYVVARRSSLHRTDKALSVKWFIAILRISATVTRPSVAPQCDSRQYVWTPTVRALGLLNTCFLRT